MKHLIIDALLEGFWDGSLQSCVPSVGIMQAAEPSLPLTVLRHLQPPHSQPLLSRVGERTLIPKSKAVGKNDWNYFANLRLSIE
jgi:hypothetical protein